MEEKNGALVFGYFLRQKVTEIKNEEMFVQKREY
jgi:hypothetical protein